MRKFKLLQLVLLFVVCFGSYVTAQQQSEDNQVHIKMEKNVDGEIVKIDEVFELPEGVDMQTFIKEKLAELGIDGGMENLPEGAKAEKRMIFISEEGEGQDVDAILKNFWTEDVKGSMEGEGEKMIFFNKSFNSDNLEAIEDDKPFMGINLGIEKEVENVNGVETSAEILKVQSVIEGAAAEKGGMMNNDLIKAIDGNDVVSYEDFQAEMVDKKIGDVVLVTVDRNGMLTDLSITLQARPAEFAARTQTCGTAAKSASCCVSADVCCGSPVAAKFCDGENLEDCCKEAIANCCKPGSENNLEDCCKKTLDGYKQFCAAKGMDCYGKKELSACCSNDVPVNKAVMGVMIEDVENGVVISSVQADKGAAKAGLKEGDVIYKIGKNEISDMDALIADLSDNEPGDKVKVFFKRDGKNMKKKVVLSGRAENTFNRVINDFDEEVIEYPNLSKRENVKVIQLNEKDLQKLIDGEELDITITDKDGVKRTDQLLIQLEEGATINCPQFNILITDLTQVEAEEVNKNDDLVDFNEMGKLKVINLSIFPNPNEGLFELNFLLEKDQPVTIRIVGIDGREAYNETIADFGGQYRGKIDLTSKPIGVYVLQILQGSNMLSRKIVID